MLLMNVILMIIEIAEDGKRHITVSNVAGINNKENPQAVIDAVLRQS